MGKGVKGGIMHKKITLWIKRSGRDVPSNAACTLRFKAAWWWPLVPAVAALTEPGPEAPVGGFVRLMGGDRRARRL